MKKKLTIFCVLFSFSFFVLAQEVEYPKIPQAPEISATTTFPQYVKYLFNFFTIVAGLVALGVLIFSAILWITSAGNPEKITQAKSKAFGAFLGLIILLSGYLILVTLNPELSLFYLERVESISGIYLITETEKEHFYASTARTSVSSATSIKVEFISPPEELTEIYIYDQPDYKGNKQRIVNLRKGFVTTTSFTTIESVYFLKKEPGLYLYDETNFEIGDDFPYPFYFTRNVDLTAYKKGLFNNKAESLMIIDPSTSTHYGAVLFSEFFSGNCGILITETNVCNSTETGTYDLSAAKTESDPPGCALYSTYWGFGKNMVSSVLTFITRPGQNVGYVGEVIFYDRVGCPSDATNTLRFELKDQTHYFLWFSACKYPSPTSGECVIPGGGDNWEGKVKSFKLLGENINIVIMSEKKCWANWTFSRGRCVEYLENAEIFSPSGGKEIPRYFFIFSTR